MHFSSFDIAYILNLKYCKNNIILTFILSWNFRGKSHVPFSEVRMVCLFAFIANLPCLSFSCRTLLEIWTEKNINK